LDVLRRAKRGELTHDVDGARRLSWLVDDALEKARIYHREPVVDALIPHFYLWGVEPEELLDHCAEREAYLARYARIAPSEIRDMDPERLERLVRKVSDLIELEHRARSSNPLDAASEDMTE
jgi:hypothetical protein